MRCVGKLDNEGNLDRCDGEPTHLIADGHGLAGGLACQAHHTEWLQRFYADDLNRGAWFEAEKAHS